MRELKQGSNPISGPLFWSEEKHLGLKVKQLACDSLNGVRITQIILATAICTLGRNAGPLEGTLTGSFSRGILEQSEGKV